MLSFLCWSALYPANLYIFSALSRETDEKIKTKVLSTAVSCVLLGWFLAFRFTFEWSWRLLLLVTVAALPFVYSFQRQPHSNEAWRDFAVAPAIEEFYYRCLLPQLQNNLLLNSLSFSLAHAHSLLHDHSNAAEIGMKCLISFAFGLVMNWVRFSAGVRSENFWFWLSASGLHGLANYVGVPCGNRLALGLTLLCVGLLFYI